MDGSGSGGGKDGSSGYASEPPRNPLLDPRLAGAGGMLIAAAAVAWLVVHGTGGAGGTGAHPSRPAPTPSVSSPSAASAAVSPVGSAERSGIEKWRAWPPA